MRFNISNPSPKPNPKDLLNVRRHFYLKVGQQDFLKMIDRILNQHNAFNPKEKFFLFFTFM